MDHFLSQVNPLTAKGKNDCKKQIKHEYKREFHISYVLVKVYVT